MVRGTWASHGVKGWYAGPSMNNYRLYHVYVTKTRGEQDSDCVEFFPHNTPLPYKSSSENVIIAARELAHALKKPAPQAPSSNIGDSQIFAIEQLLQIFFKASDNVKKIVDPPQQQTVKKSAIVPHKVHPDRTKTLPSVHPNVIEDGERKYSTAVSLR